MAGLEDKNSRNNEENDGYVQTFSSLLASQAQRIQEEIDAFNRKTAIIQTQLSSPKSMAVNDEEGKEPSLSPFLHPLDLIPTHHQQIIENLCAAFKINYGPYRHEDDATAAATAKKKGGKSKAKGGKDMRAMQSDASLIGRERSEIRKLEREIAELQKRLDKDNAALVASLNAIEKMSANGEHSAHSPPPSSAAAPLPSTSDHPSLLSASSEPSAAAVISELLSLSDAQQSLQLVFAAYGIDDLLEGVASTDKEEGEEAGDRREQKDQENNGVGVERSVALGALYRPHAMAVSQGTQTELEHLVPLDTHGAPHDPLFDKVLWVRSVTTTSSSSQQKKGGNTDNKSGGGRVAAAVAATTTRVSIMDPASSREYIKKPYTPLDWHSGAARGGHDQHKTFGSTGALTADLTFGAPSSLLPYSHASHGHGGGGGDLEDTSNDNSRDPTHHSNSVGGSELAATVSPEAQAAAASVRVDGGASAFGSSLRAACDKATVYKSIASWLTARPVVGQILHRIEPSSLKTAILTECDPTSPNTIRLALPMTFIGSNAYAMGTVIVRDHDLLLFKEGSEDRKLTRLPYRTIANIRLGCTLQTIDRTVPPPLTLAVPPAATQFFLMSKIQFSDTYRQFYRTVVIQPIDVGEHSANTATTNAAAQPPPAPSSILFDTETDCLRFLTTVDQLLQGHKRDNPFSPMASVRLPLPRITAGLDTLNIAGRAAVPTIFSALLASGAGGGYDNNSNKRNRPLSFAKNAIVSEIDIFPSHEPLSAVEIEFCATHHLSLRVFSEIKNRLITDPATAWVSYLDVAALCTPPNSKMLNMPLAHLVVDFLTNLNRLEPIEIVETLPT